VRRSRQAKQGHLQLRASGIARRRTGEEERAEAFFLCERRRRRRVPSAMREQLSRRSNQIDPNLVCRRKSVITVGGF
jgi:hypothetical protein